MSVEHPSENGGDETAATAAEAAEEAEPAQHDVLTENGDQTADIDPLPAADDQKSAEPPQTVGTRLSSHLSPSRVTLAGVLATLIGVLSTWSSDAGITLNGIEGPHNGWVAIIYSIVAVACARSVGRRSWPGMLIAAAAGVAVASIAVDTHSPPGAHSGWGRWFTLIAGLMIVGGAVWAVAGRLVSAPPLRWASQSSSAWKSTLGGAGLALSIFAFFVLGQVLVVEEQNSWPPGADAITAAGALAATERFVDAGHRPRDLGLDYAWSTAAAIEPWAEGANFFPRIFADIEAAESSVHIIMFGWNSQDVGTELTDLLIAKLDEGVEVRVIVDSQGSDPQGTAEPMYTRLAAAGAEIVVNDVIQIDSDGLLGDRSLDWRQDEIGRAEHRKLYVIDGAIAWTGGAGVEDHFRDGGFHDVMVRVTGNVVLQAQAVFLTSFSTHRAPLPGDLSRYFPEQRATGSIPIAIVQVIPGGYVSATQAIREMIDDSIDRLDIMNPYLTDKDMIERIIRAAERGVAVRIVVSENSNNSYAQAAFRHRYDDLLDAGVELWEYPGAVVHAKVIVADDTVNFGTVNLDNWALYRDFEIAMITESPETAELIEQRLFTPDIARSKPGTRPSGFVETVENWLWDKLSYFL